MVNAKDLPDFKNMPPVNGMPIGCAWGLFDKDGERDQVGTLNLLTPEVVLEAKKEIKTGESVALNWGLERVHEPGFERKKPEHRFKDLKPLGYIGHDDEIHINTQSGSQWDGLRHWAHQDTELYYNGLRHEQIKDPNCKDNGIHFWTQRGGLVGRGVLIDYHSWAQKNNIPHPATERTCIKVADIEAIAKEQNVEFKPGDIFIIRSGWIDWYNNADREERVAGATKGHNFIGLEGSEESIPWLWNHHFAAVAGDSIAFEAFPTKKPWSVHDYQLAMWGSPIGELWNLEKLAETCKRLKRWSFFITSAPLNVEGGIASPPNAVAVF